LKKITFNKPYINYENYFRNLKKLKNFNHYSKHGFFCHKCSDFLIKKLKVKKVLMTQSCTSALEMCAILLDIKKNDEIIFPSYSYVTTVSSFVSRGAKPIFIDIDKNSLCLNIKDLKKKITNKTKAVVVTNYAGGSCDMNELKKLKRKFNFFLIEDNAQALFSTFNNKFLGTFGDLSTISFHETKNIHCGEGGALIINNKKFIKRSEIVLHKGTNRVLFNKQIINRYSWVDIGSSFGLSEIHASLLFNNLKNFKNIFNIRKKIWENYHIKFKSLEINGLIKRPWFNKKVKQNYHMYYLLVKPSIRNKLIKFLSDYKIQASFHYLPLHNSIFYKKNYKKKLFFKNSQDISNQIIRLPLSNELKKKDSDYVIKKVYNFFKKI